MAQRLSYWNQPGCLWGKMAWLFIWLCVWHSVDMPDTHLWRRCLFEVDALAIKAQIRYLHYKKKKKTTVRVYKREITSLLVRTILHNSLPPEAPPLSHGSHSWPMTSVWSHGMSSWPKTGPGEAWVPARSQYTHSVTRDGGQAGIS